MIPYKDALFFYRHRQKKPILRGFSLIEVTLALGIIAFALVAIMGLIPVAMISATESQRQTQAAFIAQSMFAEISSGQAPTNTFLVIGNDLTQASSRFPLDLSAPSTTAYLLFNEAGQPLGTTSAANFSNSVNLPDAAFGATLLVTKNAIFTNLSRVEIIVEAPAGAPSNKRTKYDFLTSIRNQ